MADPAIDVRDLVKVFRTGDVAVTALEGFNLTVSSGEHVGVVGALGAGKSTLLRIIAGFDEPTAGDVRVAGLDIGRASANSLRAFRRRELGVIWQNPRSGLVGYLSPDRNLRVVADLAGVECTLDERLELLEQVGLTHRSDVPLNGLSGGEVQRVALAAAFVHRPSVVIADEPTAELDRTATRRAFELLTSTASARGTTLLVVSHDAQLVDHVDRVIRVRHGRLAEERRPDAPGRDLLVVDRIGRVQLPDDVRLDAGLGDRVEVIAGDGEVVLRSVASEEDGEHDV